ncbi:hypothetical protein N7539_009137 [Penicillium diatomitis]|uniref:Single-strand DNA deaminase toxin A-like C-terminal domain-containing protein n=1 Tax=Penicillium diatomitis TaxID=2819901 RepID=A0A9W9WL51_9EURO|nr:uncharacterized protein N7539_009137 [Penicillium diatomitis]KAJ5469519.1 hypothetical protein N7539_009137 [Penicillium diatomitis]
MLVLRMEELHERMQHSLVDAKMSKLSSETAQTYYFREEPAQIGHGSRSSQLPEQTRRMQSQCRGMTRYLHVTDDSVIENTYKREIDPQENVRLLGGENSKSNLTSGGPPTLVVSHHVPPDKAEDHDRDSQFKACHAEKQLITYFTDPHVFLPPNSKLETSVQVKEEELEKLLKSTRIDQQIAFLERKKRDLQKELFDGDEKLVREDVEIQAMKLELKPVETALNHQATRQKPKVEA